MSQHEIGLYEQIYAYTTFTADIELMTDSNGPGRVARRVLITGLGSGTISMRMANGSVYTETITAAQVSTNPGVLDFDGCHIAAILLATNVTSVRVYW